MEETMTDPRYTDPNNPLSRYDMMSANAAWGWLAGIAVLALVVVFLLAGSGNENTQTAGSNVSPPATTGSAAPNSAPMRNVTPTRPATPPSTTGSGSQGGTAR
jgi:hypothetical protein